MQGRKTHWPCPTWASTYDWAWMFPIPLILPLPRSRLNPFSHPFVSFCFNIYFYKISDSCKSCKNCTKNSHIPFPRMPQTLNFYYICFIYLSFYLFLHLLTHMHGHTHAHTFYPFLPKYFSVCFKADIGVFSSPSATVKNQELNTDTVLLYPLQTLFRFCQCPSGKCIQGSCFFSLL